MYFTTQFLQKIKDIPTSDVIGHYTKLTKKGVNYSACCPIHNEKTPSFSVNNTKEIFKCFGCGKSGDSIRFIQEVEKCTFVEAVQKIAALFNLTIEYDNSFDQKKHEKQKEAVKSNIQILQFAIDEYGKNLSGLPDEHEIQIYLHQRGFNREVQAKYRMGWATNDFKLLSSKYIAAGNYTGALNAGVIKTNEKNTTYDVFVNRIIVPIYNSNNEPLTLSGRYFKYDSDCKYPKYLNGIATTSYNKSRTLFGLNFALKNIIDTTEVYLVEGYTCTIQMQLNGFTNTVSCGGSQYTTEQLTYLCTIANTFYLFLDNDKQGDESIIKFAPILIAEGKRVYVANWEKQFKEVEGKKERVKIDPDDYLIEHKELPDFEDYIFKYCADLKNDAKNDFLKIAETKKIIFDLINSIPDEHTKKAYIDKICETHKWKPTSFKVKKQAEPALAKNEFVQKDHPIADDDIGFANFKKFGIYEYKNVYWAKGNKTGDFQISNFTMNILYHVNTGNDKAYRIVSFKNEWGYESVINFNTDDMTTISSFRKVLARQSGGFTFKGTDNDLIRLSEWLQKTERSTKMIEILGYQPKQKIYAFANGLVDCTQLETDQYWHQSDEYGIVKLHEKEYFLPASSKIYADKEDLFTNDKKFMYIKKEIDFKNWALIYKKVYGEKAMPTILFAICCIYRDIIFKKLKRFPMMFFYGQRGSGKGTMIHSLMHLWGIAQDQLMLGGSSTPKAMMRKFGQFKNALIWLDEYKNNINVKIIESLKNLYDGIGYERANTDNTLGTNTTAVNSGALVSGQEMPTLEPALFMRFILLMFEPGKFTENQRTAKKELDLIEDGGLACVAVELLKYRGLVERNYNEKYDETEKELFKEIGNKNIDDRMIVNIASILTIYKVLAYSVKFPFEYSTVKEFMISNMLQQNVILAGSDDCKKFWEIVEYLFNSKNPNHRLQEDVDFVLESGLIYIRLSNIHPLYVQEMANRKDPNVLNKPTLENYLSLNKQIFVEKKKHVFKDMYTHALVFVYSALDIDLIKDADTERRKLKQQEMGMYTKKAVAENLPF